MPCRYRSDILRIISRPALARPFGDDHDVEAQSRRDPFRNPPRIHASRNYAFPPVLRSRTGRSVIEWFWIRTMPGVGMNVLLDDLVGPLPRGLKE
jgi:hypothetical protein